MKLYAVIYLFLFTIYLMSLSYIVGNVEGYKTGFNIAKTGSLR